jgi:prophage antirepressor-like protein
MNEVQVFNNEDFGKIRTIVIDGEPWLCATDVAQALGYKSPRDAIAKHCRGVAKRDTPTSSGIQSISYINEGDMYRLIMKSKLPSAEKFEKWVMEEVLPSIRKTGAYSVPQTTAGQIQLLAQGHMELEQKIENVDKDLQTFKKEMPLLAIECQRITEVKNKKIVPLFGGKSSSAYHNASLRGRVYRDLENQLRREFGVTSYKAIRRNQTDKAIEIINAYELPLCLKEEIANENSQMSF